MTTTSATAAAAAKVSKRKVSQAKPEQQTPIVFDSPAPTPELVMLPLGNITTARQVRTEFDQAALEELAADIATHGVIEPIIVRWNPGMANMLIVAGERRYRAAKLAGLDVIPAIIRDFDETTANMIQLAENIQREELSLKDTAAAIKALYDQYGNLGEVAAKVKKSRAWVSKRLTAATSLGYGAEQLLTSGATEDLELLLAYNELEQVSYGEATELREKIKAGKAGRQTVREALAAAKERRKAAQEERNKLPTPEQIEEREKRAAQIKADQEQHAQRMRLDVKRIGWQIEKNAETVPEEREELDAEQFEILDKHLRAIHSAARDTLIYSD